VKIPLKNVAPKNASFDSFLRHQVYAGKLYSFVNQFYMFVYCLSYVFAFVQGEGCVDSWCPFLISLERGPKKRVFM
jgi:hypothetical protein